MSALVVVAFVLATWVCQRLLGRAKVQTGIGTLAMVHAGFVLALFTIAESWAGWRPVPALLFWAGAASAWFVVRGHLESSILLGMLDDLGAERRDREEFVKHHASMCYEVRIADLREAGFVARDGRPALTRRGRLALACVRLLGAPRAHRSRPG